MFLILDNNLSKFGNSLTIFGNDYPNLIIN